DVPGDHPVDQLGGIATRDAVLEQRRDVDEGGGIANGVVFVLVVHFINADRVVARPFAIVQALAQRHGAFVKCSANRQGKPSVKRQRNYSCRRGSTASGREIPAGRPPFLCAMGGCPPRLVAAPPRWRSWRR